MQQLHNVKSTKVAYSERHVEFARRWTHVYKQNLPIYWDDIRRALYYVDAGVIAGRPNWVGEDAVNKWLAVSAEEYSLVDPAVKLVLKIRNTL